MPDISTDYWDLRKDQELGQHAFLRNRVVFERPMRFEDGTPKERKICVHVSSAFRMWYSTASSSRSIPDTKGICGTHRCGKCELDTVGC